MSSEEWIETTTGNRISKLAQIYGSNSISINDHSTVNSYVLLQGDVPLLQQDESQTHTIKLGKYTYIGSNCQVIPPVLKKTHHGPIRIGSFTIIGADSIIKSASIGNRVLIEPNCTLLDLSIIYDCCLIRKGTIIPSKMIIPPFSEVKGVPGVDFEIKELNSSYKKIIELEAKNLHYLG
ncbi:hypothetical protein HYPBUDRAFT_192005 [Hyphopichia burtonii NRRL Y-1933]|uniref:Dynactin subunit 5 n=1 Tax=Hyphopichia burtonii NRRL Y-1933 TaxID=984485 RepID=A0A1E4RNH9_9ASCO|nr:hypothetical protein HYPBUDRAFT_192005 [Hyphopichia burtonii NRRL Y-1933]ODV68830.1 hypothetical protein HYPBUDRAFT_192005 [Hyphopichia burtonii NRRL Y-1933]